MNVTIRPLEWAEAGNRHTTFHPFGHHAVMATRDGLWRVYGPGCGWGLVNEELASVEQAKAVVERWHVGKVLDCLEPADRDAVDEFARIRAEDGE